MPQTMHAFAALALVLVLTACGNPSGPRVEIAGAWAGTWLSSRDAGGDIQATFVRAGDEISGTLSITGSPCLTTGSISGSVSNTNVTFGAVSGPDGIEFTGTVGATMLEGTYSVSSGSCMGDTGTFSAARQ